jgi:ribonuclease P protein component
MTDQRFGARRRLRTKADFERVYQGRCSASDGRLLVFAAANELPHARLGLSVSRKVGGAVVRNRWKRLLREAFRLSLAELPPGVDLVVIPRGSQRPELASLRQSLCQLAGRLARRLERRSG